MSWGIAVIRSPVWCFCTVGRLGDSIGEGGGRARGTQLSEEMTWQLRYVLDSFVGTAGKGQESGEEPGSDQHQGLAGVGGVRGQRK